VQVTSDLIGPIPSDAEWIVQVWSTTAVEQLLWQGNGADPDNRQWTLQVGVPHSVHGGIGAKPRVAAGDNVTLRATLTSPTIGTVDGTDSFTYQWDPTSNLWDYIAELQAVSVGQFTSDDRSKLTVVEQSVSGSIASADGSGAQIALTLFGALVNPPPNALCLKDTVTISEPVSLTRSGILGPVSAFGAYFLFSTIPPVLGFQVGAELEFIERMGQVVLWARDNCGSDYVQATYDLRSDQHKLTFTPLGLIRIDVFPLPGVVIEWTWLDIGPLP